MKLLFVNIPTYKIVINDEQAYWNKIKRICAEKILYKISEIQYEEKKSLCRGLWIIASEAKKYGHDVKWIDIPSSLPNTDKSLFEWADQIWLYALTPTFNYCLQTVLEAKKVNPHIKTIIGGPHVQFLVEEILKKYTQIDYVEYKPSQASSIISVLDTPYLIPGLAYCQNGEIKKNRAKFDKNYFEYTDVSVLPSSFDEYHINISGSRGCPRNCSFCVDGKTTYLQRSIDDLKRELLLLDKTLKKRTIIHFFDTSIWIEPTRSVELLEFLTTKLNHHLYSCDIDAGKIRTDILQALSKANFRMISLGFESCDNEILNFVSKNGTFEDRIKLAQSIRREMPNTVIKAYWLLGLPGTTQQSLKKELDGIRYVLEENIVDLVSAKLFVPYPGTDFFTTPEKFDLTLVKDFNKFDRFCNPPICYPNIIGQKELGEALIECEKLIANIYLNKLGLSANEVYNSKITPKRYNGQLYIGKMD